MQVMKMKILSDTTSEGYNAFMSKVNYDHTHNTLSYTIYISYIISDHLNRWICIDLLTLLHINL